MIVDTLDRWESLRKGPPRVTVARTILYNVDSVADWLLSQEKAILHEGAAESAEGEVMTTTWDAPDVNPKLIADLERAALAVAKARSAMAGGSVTISLELNYFGFNSYRNHSSYRKGECDLFIKLTDETRLRRICKGEGRAKQN